MDMICVRLRFDCQKPRCSFTQPVLIDARFDASYSFYAMLSNGHGGIEMVGSACLSNVHTFAANFRLSL
jgi:hypothetical protein